MNFQLTPEGKKREISECPPPARAGIAPQPSQEEDENNFFELLSRFQSGRMDDQRCVLRTTIKPKIKVTAQKNEKLVYHYCFLFHRFPLFYWKNCCRTLI